MADREHWKKLIDDMKASGMSKEEFADSRGLSRHSVHHWYYKLKRGEAKGKNGTSNGNSAPIITTAQDGSPQLPTKARKDLYVPACPPQSEDEAENEDDGLGERLEDPSDTPAPVARPRPNVSPGTRNDMLEIVFPSGAKLRFPAGTDPAYVRSLL